MRCGISTACFYPCDTLESLKRLADAGVSVVELFFNTDSELKDSYVAKIADVVSAAGIDVSSVHPFTAVMEGFYFASDYKTRLNDGLERYRRYYEICEFLGSDKLVFHGDHDYNVERFPILQYVENFKQLAALGHRYGVTLCHENVAYCRLGLPQRVRDLAPLLGQDAAFVLDLKQARRNQVPIEEMLSAMDGGIRQIHISDYDVGHNCLAPGRGEMDFAAFLGALSAEGYQGDLIIELYSDNYSSLDELVSSMHFVQALINRD